MPYHALAPSVAMQVDVVTLERAAQRPPAVMQLETPKASHAVVPWCATAHLQIMVTVMNSSARIPAISKKISSVRHALPNWGKPVNQFRGILLGTVATHQVVDKYSAIIGDLMMVTCVSRMIVRTKTFSPLSRPDEIFSHETYGLIRG